MELTTYCFERPGPENTEQTLRVALERARALGIHQAVVASSHGDTARRAQALFRPHGIRVVAVTIGHGWEANGWCMDRETKEALRAEGIAVVTGIHALGDGVATAFSAKHGGQAADEIVRDTLYRFCQGMKVAVECALMAAEAGELSVDEEAVAIAGSSSGADTAIVVKPAYPHAFLDMEIHEILAKPRSG